MKTVALLLSLLLVGCVTIPVPPFGDQKGAMGDLKVSVSVAYLPKSSPEREPTDSMKYAWSQFQTTQPKLLKDK